MCPFTRHVMFRAVRRLRPPRDIHPVKHADAGRDELGLLVEARVARSSGGGSAAGAGKFCVAVQDAWG